MRILFVTPKYPPEMGGAAHVFGLLSKNFAKRNHRVTVLTSGNFFINSEENIKIVRLFPYYGSLIKKLIYLPFALLSVFAFFLLNHRKFDIVESHTVGEICLFSQLFAKVFRKPLVKNIIDMQTPNILIKHPRADVIVCCGECIKKKIVSAGIVEDRVFSLNLPIELSSKSKKRSGKFTFVFIGEISKNKGVLDVLEVIKNLKEDFRFVFIGNGPLIDELKRTSLEDERVVVKGFLGKKEIFEVLEKSDVLVHPSYADVMPISILEAMMFKNAVIASDIGEIKKNVSDAGLFIGPGDLKFLEKHMKYMLNNNISAMKKAALRNFSAYAKNDVYSDHLKVLEKFIKSA